jgi:hypothetical protein
MSRGVVYVAYGPAAYREAIASIESLRRHNDLPVAVIGERVAYTQHIPFVDPGPGARRAKLNIDRLTPVDQTLYLDGETRVRGDLTAGFDILADGWDLVIAPSGRQGHDVLGHLPERDRAFTLGYLENDEPLNLQAGAFFFQKYDATADLFANWRREYNRFQGQDQGALLRALKRSPVKVWILGQAWNSQQGELVQHLFGKARQ